MRNKIMTYISFIAVFMSLLAFIFLPLLDGSNFKVIYIIIGLIASLIGILLAVILIRLLMRKFEGKIYISFDLEDREIASLIKEHILSKYYYLNISEKNIFIGSNIKDSIENDLTDASIVIFLISKNSENSDWTKYEIESAVRLGKKILPVLIEKNAKIPDSFKDIKFADFTSDKNRAINELIKALDNFFRKNKSAHNSRS